jgi:hypothetical protein
VKLLELLELLEAIAMDGSFPVRCSMWHLDLRFKSYRVLKISALLRAGSQPLSMHNILPKIA